MTAHRRPGRPALADDERRAHVTLRLPRDLLAQVDAYAEAEGQSRTDVIEAAIRARVGRRRAS